jgi:hypothetical protein
MAVQHVATILLGVWIAGAGCTSVPRLAASKADSELASHVEFLCHPKLKGRSPRTQGSRMARRYIEEQFRAGGLVPWAQEKAYELPFGLGRNVVGVLPGSDTNQEIVLVSAHYDHLGKQKGVCLGACDNAAGVAALLQTARRLSASPQPKRSVAFAAFDCEEQMLLGSFAFAGREDVQRAKIVAVVNVDMLGRDFLDVVQNTLFVAGTEHYPDLGSQVRSSGTNAGLRVLPLGTDLIGPRSDHVAFELRDIPCLFFSCGPYGDYHKPGDTPDKLNYTNVQRSAEVILQTVRTLCNSEKPSPPSDRADLEELRTVSLIMTEVTKRAGGTVIKEKDVEAIKNLHEMADELLKGGVERESRKELVIEATGVLAPYLIPIENWGDGLSAEQQEYNKATMQFLQYFYVNSRKQVLEGYHRLIGQILRHRPGLFRSMPKFALEVFDVADEDILVVETGGTYRLNALTSDLVLRANLTTLRWPLKSLALEFAAEINLIECQGSRDDLVDACLLHLRRYRTSPVRLAGMKKVLRAVTGTEPMGGYDELLSERLRAGGFADETNWLVSCILSTNRHLAGTALVVSKESRDERIHKAAHDVIGNRAARAGVRVAAIELTATKQDEAALLALCAVMDDTTPAYKQEGSNAHPFAERMVIKMARPFAAKQDDALASKTIGDVAHEALKNATGKDFGRDTARWRKWIQSQRRSAR